MWCNEQLQVCMEHPSSANHSRTALQLSPAFDDRKRAIDCLFASVVLVAVSPTESHCRNNLDCPARSHLLAQGAITTLQ